MNDNSTYAIKGTVQVYEKDKSGSALQLCLQTNGFEKYIIENGYDYRNFFSMIGQEVVVYCEKFKVEHNYLPYIKIKSFKVINGG